MGLVSKIRLYHKWWSAWGTLPVSPWVKGAASYRAGNYSEAERHYRAGLESHARHPASTSAHLDLAYCLFKLGRLDEAKVELKFVNANAPKCREAYIRLAVVQCWLGQSLEAAWTLRNALRNTTPDGELVGMLLMAVLDNCGPEYLLQEAIAEAERINAKGEDHVKLQVARARLKIKNGETGQGKLELEALAVDKNASRDAVLAYAESLVGDGKIAQARQHLRRLMNGSADHPRVLSLLAESYLRSGPFYNSEYALQLATSACQKTNWASPREMRILAEAYYHSDDKIGALLIASKAKEAGTKLLGANRESQDLDKLIEHLNQPTLNN